MQGLSSTCRTEATTTAVFPLPKGFVVQLPRLSLVVLLLGPTLLPAAPTDRRDDQPVRPAIVLASAARDVSPRASRSNVRVASSTAAATAATAATLKPSTTSSTVPATTVPPTTVPPTTVPAKKKPATPPPTVVHESANSAASSGSGSARVVDVALNQIGKRYVAGGTGPSSFDCSGLVFYVFNQAGIKVPRLTSDTFYSHYPKVARSELQPGDLVVSRGHIGIYVGDGQMVHASTPRGGVKRSPMNNSGTPFGFVRIPAE